MIHSRENRNVDVIIYVQGSRFRKILSDVRCLNGVYVEGFIDQVCSNYDYYTFLSTDIGDRNNNSYTVIKDREHYDEYWGRCKECDCKEGRFVNGKTGICYYKEDITNNYLTKIPEYEYNTETQQGTNSPSVH